MEGQVVCIVGAVEQSAIRLRIGAGSTKTALWQQPGHLHMLTANALTAAVLLVHMVKF